MARSSLPEGYRYLTASELRARGRSTKAGLVESPSGEIIPRRQAENLRAQQSGWRNWSEFQTESARFNKQTHRNDFMRWARATAQHQGVPLNQIVRPDSDFSRLYVRAKRSGWRTDIGGPFDDLLVHTGLRTPEADYDVGDTPTTR